jgi:hypothetical protein
MLNIGVGIGLLALTAFLLIKFRAREGVPHPKLKGKAGTWFAMGCIGLIVAGIGLVANELSVHWL